MITLTAEMHIEGENPYAFILGESILGGGNTMGSDFEDDVKFDSKNLISIESEIIDRSDIEKPSFGIISNGGSLSFNDSSSLFLVYANAGLLTEGIEIKIFLENTLTKSKKQVGLYYTTDWDYDNDNRSVSVSFKDALEKWQNIVFEGLRYSDEGMYLLELYEKLKDITIQYGYVFEDIDETSKFYDFLSKTYCSYPYLEQGSLWNEWQKFCYACSCYVFVNNDGNVSIEYEFEV